MKTRTKKEINYGTVQGNPRQAVLLSYFAGIIDGEGCLRINKMKSQNLQHVHAKAKNDRYAAFICVGMTNKQIIQMLTYTLGGSMREERILNRRSIWRWTVSGRQIVTNALESVFPYLVVKKPQAELLFELINNWKTPYRRSDGVSLEELQRREDIYLKMCKLNAVGAAATTEREGTREGEATVWTNGKPLEENSKQFSRQLRIVGQ